MGLSSLTATINTELVWTAQNNLTGSAYNPTTNNGDLKKKYAIGTAAANAASGGADEIFSFQQSVSAGSSATVDLTAMTNILGQTSVSIVRIKAIILRLLSQADDATIAANSSGVLANNYAAAVGADLANTGGSGATVTLTTVGGAISAVAVGAGGSGYPPSSFLMMVPQQAGGSLGMIQAVTNSSGVVSSFNNVAGGGNGTGYTNATVPVAVLFARYLAGGSASLGGSDFCYFDTTAAGFMAVGSTSKNLYLLNCDATHAATVEINVIGATS